MVNQKDSETISDERSAVDLAALKERAELVTINDGKRQLTVTRNAYKTVYKNKGFELGDLNK